MLKSRIFNLHFISYPEAEFRHNKPLIIRTRTISKLIQSNVLFLKNKLIHLSDKQVNASHDKT